MGTQNINQITITGNLTRDPELRALPSGTQVASLRVAVNGRRKNNESGQWEDKPNFFNVSVFGGVGVSAHQHLKKGRGVAIAGRLDWREYDDKETGKRIEKVEIVAETVQFLSDGQAAPQSAPSEATTGAPGSGRSYPAGARTDGGYGQVSTDDQGDEIPF